MNIKYFLAKGLLAIFVVAGLCACSSNSNKKNQTASSGAQSEGNNNAQLNISIFLDLSNRISPSKYPETPSPTERDLAAIETIVSCFKDDMEAKGAYRAKGCIKVFFDPTPQIKGINEIAKTLDVDLSKAKDNKEKKKIFDHINEDFLKSLKLIYQNSISSQNWIGADVWGFFKRKVKDRCIRPNYRNILVIITDGYIYHQNSKEKSANRYSYLLPEVLDGQKLRNNPNWKVDMKNTDFGLIAPRKDLQDLEVLVLEIRPEPTKPQDQDIIEETLKKWFDEMGIKHYSILGSDLPANTQSSIREFILHK